MTFSYRNVNEAFYGLVSLFSARESTGQIARNTSRNGEVIYLEEPATITFNRPRERVLFNKARDANPFFHLYESLWMLAGRDDVAPLAYYASNIANYSDDGRTLNGAYGYRWRHRELPGEKHEFETHDQLDILINHLRTTPNSRRAVLAMWNVEDDLLKIGGDCNCGSAGCADDRFHSASCPVNSYSKDVCCNLNVCFSICDRSKGVRQDGNAAIGYWNYPHLDMTVFNRSNDLIWGTLGANVVHFSMLQEYVACCLGVEVGRYHQVSNNQHVYLSNWKPNEWLKEWTGPVQYPRLGPLLVKDREVFDREVKAFVDEYSDGRQPATVWKEPFLQDIAMPMLLAFHWHKQREYDEAFNELDTVKADDWRIAGYEWISRRHDRWKAKQGASL